MAILLVINCRNRYRMISYLFPLHFTAMNLPLCQTAQGLYTGIPTRDCHSASGVLDYQVGTNPYHSGTGGQYLRQPEYAPRNSTAVRRRAGSFASHSLFRHSGRPGKQRHLPEIHSADSRVQHPAFVVFRHDNISGERSMGQIRAAYRAMRICPPAVKLTVQRNICCVLETIFRNLDSLPRFEASRIQLNTQIRLQKMLSYIYEHYAQTVTLEDIAGAANISRSEAGRCFQSYLGCSPVEALIQYRLQTAQRLLRETTLTLQEISSACGFHSVNYFSRQFRRKYGDSPGKQRKPGK